MIDKLIWNLLDPPKFSVTVAFTYTWGGYQWDYKTNKRLVGKPVVATVYKTQSKAFKACSKNADCTGVVQNGMSRVPS